MKKILLSVASVLASAAMCLAQNYPFPQNEAGYKYPYGISVTNPDNAKIQEKFEAWEKNMFEDGEDFGAPGLGRIKFDDTKYSISEGIGYGMLIYVYMANATNTQCQDHFDKLWRFYKKFSNSNGLMDWKITNYDGPAEKGHKGAAPDGDLDVAYALCLAAKQWGNDGDINYAAEAEKLLNSIYDKETTARVVGYRMIKPGDSWSDVANPCYFTVSSLKLFKLAQEYWNFTTTRDWQKVYADCHVYLERSQRNGLWPNWSSWAEAANPTNRPFITGVEEKQEERDFGWDACRVPWRLAQDYLWYGNYRSWLMIRKTLAFLDAKNIQSSPSKVGYFGNISASTIDGITDLKRTWTENGKTKTTYLSYTGGNAAWEGAFTTAFMCDPSRQENLDIFYDYLKGLQNNKNGKAGPYYAQTLQMIYLIVASGNAANFYDMEGLVSAVEEVEPTVSVYPNPCKDILTVSSPETIETVTLTAIDGAKKSLAIGQGTAQINVANLPTGMYVAQIKLKNGSTKTTSFIKE